jgi:hypothetical protein
MKVRELKTVYFVLFGRVYTSFGGTPLQITRIGLPEA